MTEVRDDLIPRVSFDEPVFIRVPGQVQPVAGRALNLSRAGIFVRVDQMQRQLQGTVQLEFALPDGPVVEADAWVVRHILPEDPTEAAGLALCFTRLHPGCSDPLDQFLGQRLQPAMGQTVRLQLGALGFPIRAQAHSAWQNVLSVDAELPFLRLGSPVSVPTEDEHEPLHGNIRWVSVHVPPDSGVPRINIGIEMDGDSADDDVLDGWDDELDPVCTPQFVEHSHALDLHLRQRRAPP